MAATTTKSPQFGPTKNSGRVGGAVKIDLELEILVGVRRFELAARRDPFIRRFLNPSIGRLPDLV